MGSAVNGAARRGAAGGRCGAARQQLEPGPRTCRRGGGSVSPGGGGGGGRGGGEAGL